MKIVFMGTPDFAVPCLKRLISDKHEVVGVFTQPDKPKGRGKIETPPPVKQEAVKNNIDVFQPKSLKNGVGRSIIEKLQPELIIVVAYGKILPEDVLEYPRLGCINIHASLLPKYRGAAPIQWAVINGESESGITAMQMDAGLDTGDMLLSISVPIDRNETAQDLHDKLSEAGADVMADVITLAQKGELKPVKQVEADMTYAKMLSKDMSRINWNDSAENVHNKVRGLFSWPMASTVIGNKIIKIHKTAVVGKCFGKAGEIIKADKKLQVACGDGNAVEVLILQAQGKRAMSADEYMRGNKITKGEILE